MRVSSILRQAADQPIQAADQPIRPLAVSTARESVADAKNLLIALQNNDARQAAQLVYTQLTNMATLLKVLGHTAPMNQVKNAINTLETDLATMYYPKY